MPSQLARTEKVIGAQGLERLKQARIILFGVGGVGSYAGEALIRSGVGHLTIVDKDVVDITNLNRQLIALHSTLGMDKVTAAAARYADIAPEAQVTAVKDCVLPENIAGFQLASYDYVLDAVDMVTAKLAIITACKEAGVPVISCMGTGNKLDPSRLAVAPIEKTSVCPLAKVMRRELKVRGIRGVKTVFSTEEPMVRTTPPGSLAFVPGAAGLMMAAEAVQDLLEQK